MLIDGTAYRSIWLSEDGVSIDIIDQRKLPWSFQIVSLKTSDDAGRAIYEMSVRGAGLIGATAGYGMFLAALECSEAKNDNSFDDAFASHGEKLKSARPTAVNLAWAVNRQLSEVSMISGAKAKVSKAKEVAILIADEDAEWCRKIGQHGLPLIREIFEAKGGKEPVNILTHCNAGWLAFVDYGSATSPIYAAHDAGVPVHVWVDETRPRNQGSRLTAWELGKHGVPHHVIVDNAGGHLMQHGMVDLLITGTDRTTYTGDVANKIGTYLKALAAKDNSVPFYVALPSSTFDWNASDGLNDIPIEERAGEEINRIGGAPDPAFSSESEVEITVVAKGSPVANYAFDVTPGRLVTGLITERGVCSATEAGIKELFPEK
jgi:methylthioribose-1-phosphate isomerase